MRHTHRRNGQYGFIALPAGLALLALFGVASVGIEVAHRSDDTRLVAAPPAQPEKPGH